MVSPGKVFTSNNIGFIDSSDGTMKSALVTPLQASEVWADKAKVSKAKLEIKSFSTALENYAIDVGNYPSTEEGLESLWRTADSVENWSGPYVSDATFNDPWGNPYVYLSPGNHYGYDYDLSSYGKDGKEGGDSYDADVTNWVEDEG